MWNQFRPAVVILTALTLITGLFYPLTVTIVAQIVFPHQAQGSLIRNGNRLLGSELIGQEFSKPEYFRGRLSATGPVPYNAASSSGSNLGPLNPTLVEKVQDRLKKLGGSQSPDHPVPVDLVTASGSGLDPHISPAAAEFQVSRVAATRKIGEDQLRDLVRRHTEGRQFGILGEPRVNVLKLNLELDRSAVAK